jgi:hypothetical protein
VIDLEEMAGRHGECWTAVRELATRYNVELPGRSQCWYREQEDKAGTREDMVRRLADRYMDKYLLVLKPMFFLGGETEEEALEILENMASGLRPTCLKQAHRRVYGE